MKTIQYYICYIFQYIYQFETMITVVQIYIFSLLYLFVFTQQSDTELSGLDVLHHNLVTIILIIPLLLFLFPFFSLGPLCGVGRGEVGHVQSRIRVHLTGVHGQLTQELPLSHLIQFLQHTRPAEKKNNIQSCLLFLLSFLLRN